MPTHPNHPDLLWVLQQLRTCIQLKLPVVQPNIADVQTMREEREKKGTHPDLVVRVCGYSALFGQLNEGTQDEIISRAGC